MKIRILYLELHGVGLTKKPDAYEWIMNPRTGQSTRWIVPDETIVLVIPVPWFEWDGKSKVPHPYAGPTEVWAVDLFGNVWMYPKTLINSDYKKWEEQYKGNFQSGRYTVAEEKKEDVGGLE